MMVGPKMPYCEVEHTADLALEVWGASLSDLFANAARGMCAMMQAEASTDATETTATISLCAPDAETLLVDWLNELLYLAEMRQMAMRVTSVQIEADSLTLAALVSCISPACFQRGIKAVTFADMQIRPDQGGYRTRIVFDV